MPKRSPPALLAVAAFLALVLGNASTAQASHVQCGDTITQDTRLDSDLLNCPGNGIVVGASGITLDLNGHSVDGNGVSSRESGVAGVSACCDVVVVNGIVRDFFWGVADFAIDSRIERIRLVDNVEGIRVSEPGGVNRVSHNLIADSATFGIWVDDSNSNVVYKNRVLRSGGAGILVSDGSGDDTLADNSLIGNRVGIQLSDDASGNRLVSNTARRNAEDGIRIEDPTNTVTRNRAVRNGDFGIEAIEGTIDGGGNRAFGNGNPLQCLNVECK